MAGHPGTVTRDDPNDAEALARYAAALADAIEAALPGWVERTVSTRLREAGWEPTEELAAAAREAGQRARTEIGGRLRALLALDVDDQPTGPLALLREAVAYPAAVLRAAGVPPVVRDAVAVEINPGDDYDLAVAAFGDLDPSVHDPGIAWGAAKAHVVLARRRREGRR